MLMINVLGRKVGWLLIYECKDCGLWGDGLRKGGGWSEGGVVPHRVESSP